MKARAMARAFILKRSRGLQKIALQGSGADFGEFDADLKSVGGVGSRGSDPGDLPPDVKSSGLRQNLELAGQDGSDRHVFVQSDAHASQADVENGGLMAAGSFRVEEGSFVFRQSFMFTPFLHWSPFV